MRRLNLERAAYDAGYSSPRSFARAIGYAEGTVERWLDCKASPSLPARRAIARVLDLSPGADCDSVVESDLDWLLEPEPEVDYLSCLLGRCEG